MAREKKRETEKDKGGKKEGRIEPMINQRRPVGLDDRI